MTDTPSGRTTEDHGDPMIRHIKKVERMRASNTLLLNAAKEANRELKCLIDQAKARGYTSCGPKRVVAMLEHAIDFSTKELS